MDAQLLLLFHGPAPPQSLTAPQVSCQPAGREQGLPWDFLSTHGLCPPQSCCCAQVSSSREVLLPNLNVQFNTGREIGTCQELLRAGVAANVSMEL